MHHLTAKNAISSQDAMEGMCIQLTIHTQAGKSKREELGKKMHSKTHTQLNIYGGHCISITSSFFRSAETF